MTDGSAHDFFAASAGVAGALVGLLFVAISVAPERVIGPDASEVHAVRATAALTAFTNALAVSLFELVPGLQGSGGAPTSLAVVGLLFIVSSLIQLAPVVRAGRVKLGEVGFLVGLLIVFAFQLWAAIRLDGTNGQQGAMETICILVVVCFLLGIERAWELLGGPRIGLLHVLAKRFDAARDERHDSED